MNATDNIKNHFGLSKIPFSKAIGVNDLFQGSSFKEACVRLEIALENEGRFGGVITFYRSPMEDKFTPTGPNVPDYQLFQEQMWHFIAPAITGEKTVTQVLNELAATMDMLLKNLYLPVYSPKLAEAKGADYWLSQPGSPWPEIKGEEEPKTMDYDELLEAWKAGKTTF